MVCQMINNQSVKVLTDQRKDYLLLPPATNVLRLLRAKFRHPLQAAKEPAGYSLKPAPVCVTILGTVWKL